MERFLFPRWANKAPAFLLFFVLGPAGTAAAGGLWYYGTQKHTEVGYEPDQPVPYSHKLHAGDLGIDCRYCHTTVETSANANIPPTATCMNCHAKVRPESAKLDPVRKSFATGDPIPWIRVHNLPDYVYFDHSVHVAAGVGCESCHGRVDEMPVVRQVQPLTMGWCLECHRDPAKHIRDPKDVTKMGMLAALEAAPAPTAEGGVKLANGRTAQPPQHCSGCHR
jgi:hypothetical protein